jgi:hypothetical protein
LLLEVCAVEEFAIDEDRQQAAHGASVVFSV